jgi:hypothetical protein
MREANRFLLHAFPVALVADAESVVNRFIEVPQHTHISHFTVSVEKEILEIPGRIYHDPSLVPTIFLSSRQKLILNCLLSRHHDGHIRQCNLEPIVSSREPWVVPFVVQLTGEYVIEILQVVYDNLARLDVAAYARFLRDNPAFHAKTEKRIISYWDCYYRNIDRREYVGFKLMEFYRAAVRETVPNPQ